MQFSLGKNVLTIVIIFLALSVSSSSQAQQVTLKPPSVATVTERTVDMPPGSRNQAILNQDSNTRISQTVGRYFDPQGGLAVEDLTRRALVANGELIAARFDVDRARARLRQAGLRPNPSIEFEQTTGRFTGAKGESETSFGVSVPLELGGQRARRMDLARFELEAAEAEILDRERRLVLEVLVTHAEAMIALRDLEITENLNNLDLQLAKFVQIRVNEGDTAPIELSLLQVEVERLRSKRALVEGRLQSVMLQLKSLAGMDPNEPLRLREGLATFSLRNPPSSLAASIEIALRSRPDLRLAIVGEAVAVAGLRLVKAQSKPEVTAVTRYGVGRAVFDETPVGELVDKDKTLSFGVSIGVPVFNRNQGAKAEAAFAIAQAKSRREFLEAQIRSQVTSAYLRYEAARKALGVFETGVIERSEANIRIIRGAYELGEFRITDLINEQRRLADSQREFTEALSEQYRSLADLQTAIGTPIVK